MDAAIASSGRIEGAGGVAIDEVDLLRAREYALLASLLARAPSRQLLHDLALLKGDDTPLGLAHTALADAARAIEPKEFEREFFALFVGVGRGELLPYASFYLTGFLNGRPLAVIRRDMTALGLERSEGLHDPEDNIAILFDVMAGLAGGHFEDRAVSQQDFFKRHLEPWAGQFFEDLAAAPSSRFYRSVATVGTAFMVVESQAFALAA